MGIFKKKRQKKIEALADNLLALVKNHVGYANRIDWSYLSIKLCGGQMSSESNERLLIAAHNLWKRGIPICTDSSKYWYPSSLQDAEPCLQWFDFVMEMDRKMEGLFDLRQILISGQQFSQPEDVVLALEAKNKDRVNKNTQKNNNLIHFVYALKQEFGDWEP